MTTLEQGAEAYAKTHPVPQKGETWEDECGKLMYRFNASFTKGWAPRGDITTAMAVMAGSTLFFPVSYNDIQVGRFVFLSLPGTPDGHVGQVVAGQGLDALCFWASDALLVKLGAFIGFGSVRDYVAKKRATFKGVSEDYAGAIPNLSSFENVTPTPTQEADMPKLIHVPASGTTPETFDVITDFTHRAVTHADASVESFAAGPEIEVLTSANRAVILAGIDANAKLLPNAAGSSTNITPVLDAIAKLSTLETADEKAIVAQLSALPTAVRQNIVAALAS